MVEVGENKVKYLDLEIGNEGGSQLYGRKVGNSVDHLICLFGLQHP